MNKLRKKGDEASKMENRTKNAARNAVFGVSLKLYQIILPFVMRTIMVYVMGAQYLGLNSLFISVLQVLNLAELGVGTAMIFSMYEPISKSDDKKICALLNLYKKYYQRIGFVILIIGVILTPFIPYLISGETPHEVNLYILYIMNLLSTVLTYWLYAYKTSIIQAHQRSDIISKITICTNTVQYLLQIIVLISYHNYYLYLCVLIFLQIITNICIAMVASKMYPNYQPQGIISKAEEAEINARIKDLFTAKLGTTIVTSADTLVISAFLGLTVLAVYQNYYYILNSIYSCIIVGLGACLAGIGNSLITETKEKNYRDFRTLGIMVAIVSGICISCFLNLFQPFIRMWVGNNFLLSYECVILLCIYFFCMVFTHFVSLYKDAAGVWHEDRYRPLVSSLINLILNIALVEHIGIFAIILSTIISYVLVNIPWILHNVFKYVFKISPLPFIGNMVKYSIAIFVQALLSVLICSRITVDSLPLELILKLLVSLFVSTTFFVIVFRNNSEFIGTIKIVDGMTKFKFHTFFSLLCVNNEEAKNC